MPIRPEKLKRYPADWRDIRARIMARAGNRCECAGECGLHHGRRCSEIHGTPGRWMNGPIVLTTAHLWQGPCRECHERDEKCGIDAHLKALCQRCHLRYDIEHHKANAAKTRDRKRGQMRFD